MAQKTPAPGKFSAHGKELIPTEYLQDEAVTTAKLSTAAKIKRAHSNVINLATLHAAVGLLYTSTAIVITAVNLYRITATVGTTGKVDVGVNGDDDAVVNAQEVAAALIDTVIPLTILAGAVDAGKMVTASIETAVGTSGTATIEIEYYENE